MSNRAEQRGGLGRLLVFQFFALLLALPGIAWAGAYEDYFKAVKLDNANKVRSLLEQGFDPNTIEAERGDTGLLLALREDAMRVFNVLVDAPGIDLEAKARNGDNAMMIAAYKGNEAAVDALIARNAEVNRPGWTALHYAAAIGNNNIIKRLLEHSAYIDAESPNKTTPIMMASRAGHIYTVKLLLDEGADASLRNTLGMTAIDFAKKNNHSDIAEGLTHRLKKAGKL
jgi:ankyrin repeat protein